MRLMDQISQSSASLNAMGGDGRVHVLHGPAYRNDRISECPLRYILDESAANECMEIITSGIDLLSLPPHVLHLPAEAFWIEWTSRPPYAEESSVTTGLLVETRQNGRQGSIEGFYRDRDGGP